MIDVAALGWPATLVGELDHRRLKAPRVKLRAARGDASSAIYTVDLRVRRPNAGASLSTPALHSVEHFLLEGFGRLLPEHFIQVGVMGCRTGFYLVFAGEGRADVLCDTLAAVLQGVLHANAVPYANDRQCGHWQDHSLEAAQSVADEVLAARASWLEAA